MFLFGTESINWYFWATFGRTIYTTMIHKHVVLLLLITTLVPCRNIRAQSAEWTDAPYLEMIIINGDSLISVPKGYTVEEMTLTHETNNIGIRMSTGDSMVFQYYLENFDNNWGLWSDARYKDYTRLPAGDYKFRVRYTDQGNFAGEMVVVKFKVLPAWYNTPTAIISFIVLFIMVLWAIYAQVRLRFARTQYMLEQIINTRTEDLILEKDKTESLLANVLPKNTATEIMEKGKATKMKYNFVTVLFSDIQGFTKIAEQMNPEVLIDELDSFFFYFDSVVERLGIEKIKTIGDAYMCAGGIPEKNRTNPIEVILAALEMQKYMEQLKRTSSEKGIQHWDIRIGIHTGTVIAGVVGHKKLSYDIWGDTVNTASRMESSGEAGKINISGTTYEFAKEFFICRHRGKMPVKYKGELDMYFVEGIVPELRDDNGDPNGKFFIHLQRIRLQDIEDIVLKMFEEEAPPNLYFHNYYVVNDICNQVDLIANAEQLPEEDFVNLKLAAMFLYTGYIYDYDNVVEASCSLAENTLPKLGFDQNNITEVKSLIKNSFNNKIEKEADKILHDARYNYLGRVDYIYLTDRLLKEEAENGKSRSRQEWIAIQVDMLRGHNFITNSATIMRSVSIEEQLAALRS
jgi:class 3 adenylate cyclase